MTDEGFARLWDSWADPETGKRKPTCISRGAVPEEIENSDRSQQWRGALLLVSSIHTHSMDLWWSVAQNAMRDMSWVTVVSLNAERVEISVCWSRTAELGACV